MATVTIVVPTFDRLHYLDLALRSLVQQTYSNFEVIVADDAGNAGNAEIVSAIGDSRFFYVRRASNIGVLRNVWGAFASAKSKYVATLNDDDLWDPRFLEALVNMLDRYPDSSVAFCEHSFIDEHGTLGAEVDVRKNAKKYGRFELDEGRHSPFIYNGCAIRSIPAAMASVFRHAAIPWADFPERDTFYDEWLSYLATREGQSVCYTSQRLSFYRVHAGSATSRSHESLLARMQWRSATEYINRVKAEDQRLRMFRPIFVRKHLKALVAFAMLAMAADDSGSARARIIESKNVQPRALLAALWFATSFPKRLYVITLHLQRLLATVIGAMR